MSTQTTQIDYTTYDIKKGLLKLSVPAMGASFFSAAYDLADMFWIGKLGKEAIAGVTVAMTLYWFGSVFNDLFGTPSVILFSRRYGEKDQAGMQKVFSQTILLKLTFATIFMLMTYFFRWELLGLLGSTDKALAEAVNFFSMRVWFMPVAFASFTINTAFRSSGDVNRFAILQFVAAVFNMVFDPIFIFCFKMGVAGAAFTTGLSDLIVLLTGLYWLHSGKSRVRLTLFHSIKPDWQIIRTMFKLGLPTIFDTTSNHLIGLFSIRILNIYGVTVVAAWGVINRVKSIVFFIAFSLEMAVATLVGQNLGAGFRERAKQAAFAGIQINLLLIGCFTLLVVLFAPWIIAFFNADPDIMRIGATLLRLLAIGDLFFAGYMASLGALSGAGQTSINMFISIIGNWVILAPVFLIVAVFLKLNFYWLALPYVINCIALFLMSFSVIRGERWLMREI